jgi:hypothetical protein
MRIRDPGWKKFGSGIEKIRIRDKHLGSATLGTGIPYMFINTPVMSTVAYMCLLNYVSDFSKSQVRKMADWDAEDFEPELAPKPVVK